MVASGFKVRGLRETLRAFHRLDRGLKKELRDALKEAAEPVARDARDRLSRYAGASIGTIRPRASQAGAFVTQGARKVTGHRGDFGQLQMTRVMIPALEDNADEIEERAGRALDTLLRAF